MYLVVGLVEGGVTGVLHALDQSGGGSVQARQEVKAFAITGPGTPLAYPPCEQRVALPRLVYQVQGVHSIPLTRLAVVWCKLSMS